jgi:hypothetical protein
MLKSDLSRNLSDLALPSDSSKSGVMMERVLHVSIRNSLSNLALAGQNGGVWRLVEGSAPRTLGEGATCQLNSALMHEVTILQQHSDFPVPLGVHLNCVPPKEFTEIGDAYSYTVLPHSKTSTPETIFKAQPLSEDMYDWHETFPGYNDKNLDTEGIMHVNNQAFVFVDCQDPAVAVLARAVAPTMEVHASTQMTVSSPEAAVFAKALGVTRIVPSSVAMPLPARPVTMRPVSTGDSSLASESATVEPTRLSALKRRNALAPWSAKTAPVNRPVSSTMKRLPTPTNSIA